MREYQDLLTLTDIKDLWKLTFVKLRCMVRVLYVHVTGKKIVEKKQSNDNKSLSDGKGHFKKSIYGTEGNKGIVNYNV